MFSTPYLQLSCKSIFSRQNGRRHDILASRVDDFKQQTTENTTRPFAPKDASILPSGLQAQNSATRRAPKLLVCNCPTSAEKLPDFSAEVCEVLLSVFKTSRKEVIFFFAFCSLFTTIL
jgi:hypothetical protein